MRSSPAWLPWLLTVFSGRVCVRRHHIPHTDTLPLLTHCGSCPVHYDGKQSYHGSLCTRPFVEHKFSLPSEIPLQGELLVTH